MADNYIEKQYEQYQARKAAWEKNSKNKPNIAKSNSKRVFITGGASGIGRILVQTFCMHNYKVAFCDIDDEAGKLLSTKTNAIYFHVDVCIATELESCMNQLFAEWGDIDIIINNVGVSQFTPITETTLDDFDRIIATNLRSAFITSRRLAIHRETVDNKYGRIINIASTRYLMSEANSEGYAASKGGLNSLTHALAMSLAPFHITVNAISPGWIQNENYANLRQEDHAQHPSGRVGKPEDIARMCLFVCQSENDFINGENIVIDGGMTRKMIYLE